MGAREYVRASLGELNSQFPEFSIGMANAWRDLVMAGGFPKRFMPITRQNGGTMDYASINWIELVHGRVLTACQHGPARRRAQALMWLKRAALIAAKERIGGRR